MKPPSTTEVEKTERALRDTALGLLARREHSLLELHHKLTRRGYDTSTVMQVLHQLQAEDWLNEQRYADVYASARADKGYGPLRIQRELRERGIDAIIIDSVLAELSDVWQAKLHTLCQRRLSPPKNLADKAKQQRFLRQRGFTFEQINHYFSDH